MKKKLMLFVISLGIVTFTIFSTTFGGSNNGYGMMGGQIAPVGNESYFVTTGTKGYTINNKYHNPTYVGMAGTVISNHWILSCSHGNSTVAQLVDKNNHSYYNYYEDFNLYSLDKNNYPYSNWDEKTNSIQIDKIVYNPLFGNYKQPVNPWDISLIHLSHAIPTGTQIASLSSSKPDFNDKLRVFGWGLTGQDSNNKSIYPHNLLTEEEYVDNYSDFYKYNNWPGSVCDPKYQFLAGPQEKDVMNGTNIIGTRPGDSGGGIFKFVNNIPIITGITSGMLAYSPGYNLNFPGVFCNIAGHLDWIKNIVENTFPQEHDKVNIV